MSHHHRTERLAWGTSEEKEQSSGARVEGLLASSGTYEQINKLFSLSITIFDY